MPKRFLFAFLFCLLSFPARATECWSSAAIGVNQADCGVVNMYLNGSNQAVGVSPTNPLPVTVSGGGGGGLSVTDQSAFTAGTSAFTPAGGVYNDTATLTSGQQGTFRLTAKRGQVVDVDTTGNNLYSALTAPIPAGTNTIGNIGSDPSLGKGTPSSVAINVSTATTTQLVPISGTTSIYVTSFDVIAGGTGNITFEYGTGVNCATGTTLLTGAYNLTAQAGIAKGNGAATILKVPAGNALCVLTSAAVQMSGSVSYQQF